MDAVKNFGKVTVSTGYDGAATSIVLTGGHGAKLPQPTTEGNFNLVWWDSTTYSDPSDDPNVEIVRCTARSTDTLTVTRAQEGTAASTKNTGSKVYLMGLTVTLNGANQMAYHLNVPDTNETVPASSSAYAADYYEIPSGFFLELLSESILEVG